MRVAWSPLIGLPKYQPWPTAQPKPATAAWVAASSMPSTLTGTSSASASVVTARTIAALSGSLTEGRDEAAVDLDHVERQRAQVGERRKAGAEIVERQPDALVLEAGDDRPGEVDVGEQRAFGDFDHQPLGREAGFGQQPDDPLRKPAVGQLRSARC